MPRSRENADLDGILRGCMTPVLGKGLSVTQVFSTIARCAATAKGVFFRLCIDWDHLFIPHNAKARYCIH